MGGVNYDAGNPKEKRRSHHNKQSRRGSLVLLQFILSFMSAIYGRNSAVKSFSDCQIRHADCDQAKNRDTAECNYPLSEIQYVMYS